MPNGPIFPGDTQIHDPDPGIRRRRLQDLTQDGTIFGDNGITKCFRIRFESVLAISHNQGQTDTQYPLSTNGIILPGGQRVEATGFLQESFVDSQRMFQRAYDDLFWMIGLQSPKSVGLGQQAQNEPDLRLHSGLSTTQSGIEFIDPAKKTVMELVKMFRGREFVRGLSHGGLQIGGRNGRLNQSLGQPS